MSPTIDRILTAYRDIYRTTNRDADEVRCDADTYDRLRAESKQWTMTPNNETGGISHVFGFRVILDSEVKGFVLYRRGERITADRETAP